MSWRPEEEPPEAEQAEKALRIEFSPSMFQLRELNLKCQTVVEQALIEYENQLVASVPSASQYIEVIPQRNKVSPSLRAAQRQNGRQSGYQRRERNNHAKPSSGAAPMRWPSILVHWSLIAMTTSSVAVIRFKTL